VATRSDSGQTRPYELRLTEVMGLNSLEPALVTLRSEAHDLVLIDLEGCRELDTLALLRLLVAVHERARNGHLTRFRLPSSRPVRHRLLMCKFLRAAGQLTDSPPELLVDLDNLGQLSESLDPLDWATGGAPQQMLGYLNSIGYFGFSAYRLGNQGEATRMVDSQLRHWSMALALPLFERHLKGDAQDVARVIVQQLLANIKNHVSATRALIASEMHLPAERTARIGRDFLTIALWDDGNARADGTAATSRIRDAANEGNSQSTEALARLSRYVRYYGTVSSRLQKEPADLLLEAFAPGPVSGTEQLRSANDLGLDMPILLSHVVDVFHGMIELHRGNASVFIEADASGTAHYQAKLTPRSAFGHPGNLVVVYLPTYDSF
jgi:hypothetical protein